MSSGKTAPEQPSFVQPTLRWRGGSSSGNGIEHEGELAALQANERARANFQRYSEAYRRIGVAFVDGARGRPAEFEKRLRHLVRMTEQDRPYGYGIEAYY